MANNVNTASPDLDEPLAIQSHTNNDDHHESLELSTTEMLLTDSLSPTISQPMKDKCREWEGSGSQGMPLTLLDLPVDVLRLIVNEASTDPSHSSVDICKEVCDKVTC